MNIRPDLAMKLIHQVTKKVEVYHTHVMRRDFAERYKNLCQTSPVLLREIYQDLIGDCSASVSSAISKEVQTRLRLALDTVN